MEIQPLRIQCWLRSPLGTFDDWSPDLGALLERAWFDRHYPPGGSSTITAETLVHAPIPLGLGEPDGTITSLAQPTRRLDLPPDWFWRVSAPCYRYKTLTSQPTRKSHRPQTTLDLINNPGRYNPTTGDYKSFDLSAPGRCVEGPITWYAWGDRDGVADLLSRVTVIGRNRKQGQGFLARPWSVEAVSTEHCPDLWTVDGRLMRPFPVRLCGDYRPGLVRNWCWRPPGYLSQFAEPCAMPVGLVRLDAKPDPTKMAWGVC